jgi:hypothetical protein
MATKVMPAFRAAHPKADGEVAGISERGFGKFAAAELRVGEVG